MYENKKINGFIFNNNTTFFTLFNQRFIYGFSKKLKNILQIRLESKTKKKIAELKFSKTILLFNTLFSIFPPKNDLKKKYTLNIFMLDVITSYRGFRHSVGLPTRGQRTWSNAWSVYRSNLTLRQFKINLSRKMYTTVSLSDLNVAYLAEQVNNLWRLQWESEWKFSRKQRQGQTKKSKTFFNVDLKTIASANINVKKKKKNYIIGFDPGFTKYVFKQSTKTPLFKKKNYKNFITIKYNNYISFKNFVYFNKKKIYFLFKSFQIIKWTFYKKTNLVF